MKAVFFALTFLLTAVPCAAGTIYVDDDATGANTGTSWVDAYVYLQDGLMVAPSGDEIHVAQGVYRPDQFALSDRPNLGRAETFQLKNGVTIRGGYAGLGGPDPNARDIARHKSVLSGDLSGTLPELTEQDFDMVLMNRGTDDYNNCYHVVTASGTDTTAVIDGFTITGGTANGPAFGQSAEPRFFQGAGVYMESGSPTLIDCTITGNIAFVCGGPSARGGGMYCLNSSPNLIRCSFIMNWADDYDSDAFGAGMTNDDSNPTLIDCTFRHNGTLNWGGAISNTGTTTMTLTGCTFIANRAQYGGGAIWHRPIADQLLTVEGCLFAGNSSTQPGGAISASGQTALSNCTFTGNRSPYDGGPAIDADHFGDHQVKIVNCILQDEDNEISAGDPPHVQVQFSNVKGGWDGTGNIDADPCFAQAGHWDVNGTPQDYHDDIWVNGDYHVKSQAGRWDPNTQSWIQDDVTSPCIDTGDPASPIGNEPFPNGGIINMGAYGGTAEASRSYFGKPVCETIIAGDINGDCVVDFTDFALLGQHWAEGYSTPNEPPVLPTVCVHWFAHASVKIWSEDQVIYVDPRNLSISPHDATIVLVTHTHGDHYSPSNITNVSGPGAQLIGPSGVIQAYGSGQVILPGQTIDIGDVRVTGVASYNINKTNHPKSNNWLGFIVEVAGRRVYCAGDTDLIPEMSNLGQIDVAFLPASGTYTMTASEAAQAAGIINPTLAVPYHWGTSVGTLADAQLFARTAACNAKVMSQGETLCSESWANDFSLMAHYKLDESAGTIASDSAGTFDGALHDGPVWQTTSGKIDGALEFDGVDDYVETPFICNPSQGSFSVLAWIKTDAAGKAIISQQGTYGVSWLAIDSMGRLVTELHGSGRGQTPLPPGPVITDNQWHRIGLVWDGAYRTLYVDDAEAVKDIDPQGVGASTGGLYFGVDRNLSNDTFFSGLIDDVRIHHRAVNP